VGSPAEAERLATGSLVEQLALVRDRLRYQRLSGAGPPTGWVSVVIRGPGGEERPLAVRHGPEQLSRASPRPPPQRVALVGLMAAQIRTEGRLRRLRFVLLSVRGQEPWRPSGGGEDRSDFFFVLSWACATEELGEGLAGIVEEVNGLALPGPRIVSAPQAQPRSQFQHLREALGLAEELVRQAWAPVCPAPGEAEGCRSAWVVFGDDDDIWHPKRMAECSSAIVTHRRPRGVAAFATASRVVCARRRRVRPEEMPTTAGEVDAFLARGLGTRLDAEPGWAEWLRSDRAEPGVLPIPQELGLEYFDFCPRLRLVREFFARTPETVVSHRLCDLRFCEFLRSYPHRGREAGLVVSFFRPGCWMLFYATALPDAARWERSVEAAEHGEAGRYPGSVGPSALGIDVNDGHMSSSLVIGPVELELAERVFPEFQLYEASMTTSRLARYWAAFRSTMETHLIRRCQDKLDQRLFDVHVFVAVNSSFFRFSDWLERMPDQSRAESACRMMYYVGQGFAKAIASSLGVSILWVQPGIFIGRDVYYSTFGQAVPLLSAFHRQGSGP